VVNLKMYRDKILAANIGRKTAMRKHGFVSPAKAARMVGVSDETMRNWVRRCVCGRPSMLKNVEVNRVTGWMFIGVGDIERIKTGQRLAR
jgi:hypothetical protein